MVFLNRFKPSLPPFKMSENLSGSSVSPLIGSPPGKLLRRDRSRVPTADGSARSRSSQRGVSVLGAHTDGNLATTDTVKRVADGLAAGPAPVDISSPVTRSTHQVRRTGARSVQPGRARSVRPSAGAAQQAIVDQSPKKIDCSASGLEELRSWAVAMFTQQNEALMKFCHAAATDRDRLDRL